MNNTKSNQNEIADVIDIEWTIYEGIWKGEYEGVTYMADLSNDGWWKVRNLVSGKELQCRRERGNPGMSVDDDDEDRNWLVQRIARGV